MANRNQDNQSGRSRGNYRGWDDNYEEGDSSSRAGSYDQGRSHFGRDTDEQSGSTGRYAGYGEWGQGDYSSSNRGANTGQNRYGMTGAGGGRDQGYGQGNYGQDRGGSQSNYGGQSNYGSGRYDRESGGSYGSGSDSGRGRDSDYGYGYGGSGGSSRSGGSGRGWNEPSGEGQQYGGSQRGWEGGGSQYGGSQGGSQFGQRAGSGQSSGYAGPGYGYGGSGTSQGGSSQFGGSQPGSEFGYGGAQGGGSQYGNYGSQSVFGGNQTYNTGSSQFAGQQSQGSGQSQGLHRGKGPKGYQRSDERVKEMISERLRDDAHIDASEITVTVSGGKVTLEGTVDSRQAKNAAEDIAEQCGCEDVQNNLRVQRTQGQGTEASTMGGSNKSTSGEKDKDKGESGKQRH